MIDFPDYDDVNDEPDEWDDEWPFDCAMDRHGQCGKAGSEECDFECPIMLGIHRREVEKRAKAKEKRLRKVEQP